MRGAFKDSSFLVSPTGFEPVHAEVEAPCLHPFGEEDIIDGDRKVGLRFLLLVSPFTSDGFNGGTHTDNPRSNPYRI